MKKFLATFVVVTLAVMFAVGASAETYLRGDINTDGRVTASDARQALRVGAKLDEATETQKLIADMNDDGKITAMDARVILRISAKIEEPKGEISIGGMTEDPKERTELSNGISMSFKDFMKKFGGMSELDTADGTIVYVNDYVTAVSDPKMISSGNINSISITGGDYMLCGVWAGMPVDEAISTLKSAKWRVEEENASQVILSKVSMNIKIAKAGEVVSFVEYYLGVSVVRPDDPTTESTQPPETTTQSPEITTQPPETTTKPPETTTQPPVNNEVFENLPEQVKAFVRGNFTLSGYIYDKDNRNFATMYVTKDNIRCSMPMDDVSMDMLITNLKGKSKTYIICEETNKYCELSSFVMGILGMKPEDLNFSFSSIDPNKMTISTRTEKEGFVEYTVYTIKTNSEKTEIYMVGDDIKRICGYDKKNILVSRIDVESFSAQVDTSVFSLEKYDEGTIFTVFPV